MIDKIDVKKLEEIVKHGYEYGVEPEDSVGLFNCVQKRIYYKAESSKIVDAELDAYCLELSKRHISIYRRNTNGNNNYN